MAFRLQLKSQEPLFVFPPSGVIASGQKLKVVRGFRAARRPLPARQRTGDGLLPHSFVHSDSGRLWPLGAKRTASTSPGAQGELLARLRYPIPLNLRAGLPPRAQAVALDSGQQAAAAWARDKRKWRKKLVLELCHGQKASTPSTPVSARTPGGLPFLRVPSAGSERRARGSTGGIPSGPASFVSSASIVTEEYEDFEDVTAALAESLAPHGLPAEPGLVLLRGATVGQGVSASVQCAVRGDTGECLAIKSVQLASRSAMMMVEKEVAALRALQAHPHLVQYLGGHIRKPSQAEPWPTAELFFEYAGGGSLHSILKGGSGLPGSLALRLAGQVLSALEHCHRCGIAHRDVKGANVLLFPHGIAKLADFGSSKVVNTLPRSPGSHAASPTGDGSARAATPRCQGTIAWMAPELMQETGAPCDAYKADVWSFGCLCVELLTGGPPWKAHRGVGEMMMAISATPASDVLPPDLPVAWREAILSCLQHDPSARPSTSQLLQLPLFGGHVDEDRGESGTLGGPGASPRVPEPLAYLLRDWLADTTYRMRVSRVLDLLAQGTEEALPSARSGPRSARSRNVLWAGEVPRLSLTDVRRVALLMRGRLQSTAYVVDDVLWGLQELWPVWGSEGDLLLQGLPPARHDGGAQLHQLQQSPAMTQEFALDAFSNPLITSVVDIARAAIKDQEAGHALQSVSTALGCLADCWMHTITPVPAPLLPTPAITEVFEDDEGYEVVNEDAEGVYVPSQLHAGMLLQWLHAARQSLADQRLAGGHPGQSSVCTVMDRHAAVYRSWRHAHQLSMAVLEVQSGLQGILLACSAASKHADSAEDSGQVDLEQMLASLGRAAVATVNRSMLLHNAACTLHQGMWQRDFWVATRGDPAPETEEGEAATWEGGWYEDEWGDASGELGESLAVEEGAEATQDEPGTGLVAMALADYHPATDTELAFQEGDLIIVHTQHESGWWEGDCNGETGWFPSNHVAVQHTLFPILEEEEGDETARTDRP